jgi:hypothetical protein
VFPRRPCPRGSCPRCHRSIAINADGHMRSHFCPHYKACELGICSHCAEAAHDERPDAANDAPPSRGASADRAVTPPPTAPTGRA